MTFFSHEFFREHCPLCLISSILLQFASLSSRIFKDHCFHESFCFTPTPTQGLMPGCQHLTILKLRKRACLSFCIGWNKSYCQSCLENNLVISVLSPGSTKTLKLCLFLCFERERFTTLSMLVSKPHSSCLSLPGAGLTGLPYHACLKLVNFTRWENPQADYGQG